MPFTVFQSFAPYFMMSLLFQLYFISAVSYRLQGRMGSRDDLRKAIQACRSAGVRVYADAVINHMVRITIRLKVS